MECIRGERGGLYMGVLVGERRLGVVLIVGITSSILTFLWKGTGEDQGLQSVVGRKLGIGIGVGAKARG